MRNCNKTKIIFNDKHIHVSIQNLCYFKVNNPITAVWNKCVYKIMDCPTLIKSALLHLKTHPTFYTTSSGYIHIICSDINKIKFSHWI